MQSISLHQALIDMVLEQYEYAAIFLIAGKQKSTEEEIVCALAPFGALSHLSAMFIHGITDRIPNKIYYTAPADTVWRSQYLEYLQNKGVDGPVPHYLSLAPMVSGEIFNRPIQIRKTKDEIPLTKIRNSPLRVTTIGKTFVDMLRDPTMCGGEDHVLDVFINEASRFQNEILKYAEQQGRAIDRSRIGFIFDKMLEIKEPRIEQWKREQVRGGSKKLSPNFPFSSIFDEGWCLSVNVESAQQYI